MTTAGTGLEEEADRAAPGGTVLDGSAPDGSALDDATLVARARDRDVDAFAVLLRRYQRRIHALCYRMLDGAGAEAEDATQEVFVTAWRRLPELQQDAAFGAWLYRAATNRCLNLLRTRRPTVAVEDATAPPARGPDGDPARSAQNSAAMTALTDALQHLPPTQRACWLLREVHGRSYEEIAHLVEATPDAVRGRIARARIELAEVMAPWR